MKQALELATKFEQAKQALFDYFGYVEDWVVIPVEIKLDCHWMLCGPEDSNSTSLVYSDKPFTKKSLSQGTSIYSATIYTQRFLPKWVYRRDEMTMISVDTHCDGNKYLLVVRSDLECKDESFKKCYLDRWGHL